MVLNRKGFFLELGDHDPKAAETKPKTKTEAKPDTEAVKVESAPKSPKPAAAPAPVEASAPVSAPAPVAVAAVSKTDSTAKSSDVEAKAKPSLTTAEAIAAELSAAEAAKPEVELVTFAPEALQPGNSIRPGKRRPGNNLAGFRSMAAELFKS